MSCTPALSVRAEINCGFELLCQCNVDREVGSVASITAPPRSEIRQSRRPQALVVLLRAASVESVEYYGNSNEMGGALIGKVE